MRSDIALFLSTTTIIAVVALILWHPSGASQVTSTALGGAAGYFGTLMTGNPQFHEYFHMA
jgi:uncharacterized membrane protein